MANFMPIDQYKEQQLNEKLSKTIFNNPSTFIEFYNSGLINTKNDDIKSMVSEITRTYKNVKDKGNKIVFLSEQEIYLEEIQVELAKWSIITKIKRDLRQLLSNEELSTNDVIVFTEENIGYICQENDEDNIVRIGNEKLFSKQEDIVQVANSISSLASESTQSVVKFRVSDIMNTNDEFITRIYEILP